MIVSVLPVLDLCTPLYLKIFVDVHHKPQSVWADALDNWFRTEKHISGYKLCLLRFISEFNQVCRNGFKQLPRGFVNFKSFLALLIVVAHDHVLESGVNDIIALNLILM